jgi:mannose-6-phosphate isomerase-like protein (cupin superfamily)
MDLTQKADRCRQAILDFYLSDRVLSGCEEVASKAHVQTVVDAISSPLPINTAIEPQHQPVNRYWDQVTAAANSIFENVIETSQAIEGALCWLTNTSYIGIFDDHFFDNEAYTEVIGPNGLLQTDACRVGWILFGENLNYPSHHHESSELYHCVSGTGTWQQGQGEETLQAPGSAIFHDKWQPHAMRTTEPCLNLWSWTGNVFCVSTAI